MSLREDVNSADLTEKETPKQFKANVRRDMCSYVCSLEPHYSGQKGGSKICPYLRGLTDLRGFHMK